MAELARKIMGLSPRVRGNQRRFYFELPAPGTIPACAGEPGVLALRPRASWDYPRVCGGTRTTPGKTVDYEGLSPRVRGNPVES